MNDERWMQRGTEKMNKAAEKTVSVVVCTYNGGKYLAAQLDTLLNQTHKPIEIIIQDDHSTDNTMEVAQAYAARHECVVVRRHAQKTTINDNFFSAMRSARGEWIAVCDQDDLWEADKLERQLEAIGDKMLCACLSKPFSEGGVFAHYDARTPNYSVYRMLFVSLPGHTMLLHRRLLEVMPSENALYEVSMYDVALGLAAAAYESVAFVPAPLVNHRRHVGAATLSDYKDALPSVGNAWHILWFSLCHYTEMKRHMRRYMRGREAFLSSLDADNEAVNDARKIVALELEDGVCAFVRLAQMFFKHRKELFFTRGGGWVKGVRALLYPVMQMYHYRFLLKK